MRGPTSKENHPLAFMSKYVYRGGAGLQQKKTARERTLVRWQNLWEEATAATLISG